MVERLPATDEDLMQTVQTGGRPALSTLMRRFANSLLTFLCRMTGDHHRREELFQEVFLAVWQQRKDYQHPKSFRAWLFGIALNQCRSSVRQHRRQPALLDGDQIALFAEAVDTPHDTIIAIETSQIVQQAVLQLPEQQRQVLVLRVWNGLSYQAIGQILQSNDEAAIAECPRDH